MDGQAKLTRTNSSSLLRQSPTVRSSIHSLSSVSEITSDSDSVIDLEEQKPHSMPVQPGSTRCIPVLALISLSLYALSLISRRDGISASETLLFALTLVAFALVFVAKNKSLIIKTRTRLLTKLGLFRHTHKPVPWFIGESIEKKPIENSEIIREGVEFYSNGDYYEGEFHKGKCNGSGIYNYFQNGRYAGDWVDGRYDGYGIEGWARGSRYRGMYRQGLRHGFGEYKFYTGDTYTGEWCNGQSHGVGVQSCSDGSCYVGEFKHGVKHGVGCYHFRNGDRYAGEYFGDKIHGFGTYHFANGHCYEGSWHEGRKQGYGMYTFRNGDRKFGEWDSGNLKTPSPQLTDSIRQAVQAARRTAENAFHIRLVDEQVNRAVMAANRAATAARVAAIKAVQNRIDGKFCDTDS